MLSVWMALAAHAQPTGPEVPVADEAPPEGPSRYAAGVRYRNMWVPNGIVDSFYFDADDRDVLTEFARPKIRGWALGAEFGIQPFPASFQFFAEYININIEEGYWDDKESPPDYLDGDWIRAEGLGIFGLGASYTYELALTDVNADVWVSMHFGAGLGIGFATGNLTQWHPGGHPENVEFDCLAEDTAIQRKDKCKPDTDWRPPPVVPLVDITLGARVHIAQHAHIRADFGVHDMLYAGVAGGGEW